MLADGKDARFLFLPDGEDPDDFVRGRGKAAFERAIDGATPLSEYLLSELAAQHPPDTAEGRAALVAAARPYVEPDHCAGLARPASERRSLNSPDCPTDQLQMLLGSSAVDEANAAPSRHDP